jgi:hypothetical protein
MAAYVMAVEPLDFSQCCPAGIQLQDWNDGKVTDMCCGSCFLVCRGRVLVWHPHTRKAHVVASGLYYPDGVVVSDDGSYLLVVETDALRVVKLWLTGDKVGMGHSLLQIYAAMQAVPAPELFNSWSSTGAACAATQLGHTAANGCLTCSVMCPCLGLDQ